MEVEGNGAEEWLISEIWRNKDSSFQDEDFCSKGGTTHLAESGAGIPINLLQSQFWAVWSQPFLNFLFGSTLQDQHINKHLSLNMRTSLAFGGIASLLLFWWKSYLSWSNVRLQIKLVIKKEISKCNQIAWYGKCRTLRKKEAKLA